MDAEWAEMNGDGVELWMNKHEAGIYHRETKKMPGIQRFSLCLSFSVV